MNRPEYHRFLTEVSMKRLRGASSCLPDFSGAKRRPWRRAGFAGEGEGLCSSGLGREVSGSGFEASVFDIWAMRDDGPPKMSPRIFTFCDSGAVRARQFISRLISYYESDTFYWRLRIKSIFWPLSMVSLAGNMCL